MPVSKKQIIEAIQAMPEEEITDIDVVLERIMLLEKFEKAEKDIVEGNTYSNDDAKEYLSKWLQ